MLNLVRSLYKYLNNIPQLNGLDVEVWAEIMSLALWCPQQPLQSREGALGNGGALGGTGAMDSQRRETKKRKKRKEKKERKKDKVESDNEKKNIILTRKEKNIPKQGRYKVYKVKDKKMHTRQREKEPPLLPSPPGRLSDEDN